MPVSKRLLAVLACLCLVSHAAAAGPAAPRPQYVVISFDGAHDTAQWERSRALARRTGAHFTYFLSCVFLLSPQNKREYRPPRMKAGRSNVGFAKSKEDVAERLRHIWAARAEGHEIASHGCGHFDGKDWTRAEWATEFAQFRAIVRDAWTLNGIDGEPEKWRDFALTEISGFRAPYLAVGDALATTLAADGFSYDASSVSRDPAMPARKGGLWRFSLPLIPEGPSERRVIAMDYNLFVRHSDGAEQTDENGAFEGRTYEAFMQAFRKQYSGDRTPLQIGFHFTLMNGGAYWRALERFAGAVCGKPDVACVSYRDLVGVLEAEPARGAGG